jgi:hypothetical protein
MRNTSRRLRAAFTAGAVAIASIVSGCGFDGVELNGAVFDVMGLSGTGAKAKEPEVAARPGIVVPPHVDRLPQPGQEGAVAAAPPAAEAWPNDPDQRKVADVGAVDRQHEAFCREALWKAQAAGQDNPQIKGPRGMCNPSILRNITGKDITTRQ